MPQPGSLHAAVQDLLALHGITEPDDLPGVVEEVLELLAQPHEPPSPTVAWATGALAGALLRGGSKVEAPPAGSGVDHSDVLHWHDGLGQVWVLRLVGKQP